MRENPSGQGRNTGGWNYPVGTMPDRPSFTDESVMMRWMKLEISRINAAVVIERIALTVLCKAESPSAKTKAGKEHVFNRDALRTLCEQVSPELQDRLRLPILFYFDMDVPDSCYLTDEIAVRALQGLGEISLLRTPRKGRVWVSRPLVYAMMQKYPSLIQIIMG
jgi:uncharacterized protein (UPF0216 family)